MFDDIYAMRDPHKDAIANEIRRKSLKYYLGLGVTMGFFIFLSMDRKNKTYLLPAVAIYGLGLKYES